MSSIREVAKLAGVSPATVSRVMNGTAHVDSEKEQRVLKAIEDTGFVPNEVARSLFRRSARIIGLIIPSLQNPFFAQMAGDIDEAASAKGYRTFLCQVEHDLQQVRHTLRMLESMNVDGVVLAVSSGEIEKELANCHLPVVAIDCMEHADHVLASVYCDYYRGGRMAMEHLLDCGCRKVICVRGNQRIFSARMRYQGYRDLCIERGIREYTLDCDYDFRRGADMLEYLLPEFQNADGIFACNDMAAISIFKLLRQNGIRVPEEVRLIGFDDINLSQLMSPELTTIRQPVQDMAEAAVDFLTEHCEREQGTVKVFPVTLMKRETTVNGLSDV